MSFQIAVLSFVTSIIISYTDATERSTLSPILIITGFSGSRLNVQDSSASTCNTNGETFQIWINFTHLVTAPECYINQLKLNYTTNGEYLDAQGVTITTPNFGSVLSDALSEIFQSDANLFLDYFFQRGYTDVNLRSAPYDWRLSAEQLNQRGYYANVRELVEEMYEQNNNAKVTLLVLSMGGPVSHYFLTRVVTQEWKDTYIDSYIALAAAWSGTGGVPSGLITEPPANIFLFLEIQASLQELHSLYRSWPSYYFLLPHASVWNDTILVTTPTKNYTANDYQQLFTDAGFPQGYTQFMENNMARTAAPNVPTYCFYGLGIPTPLRSVYGDDFPDAQPTIIYGDGDDTVNKESLEACLLWANSGYPFNRTVFPGVNHTAIVTDKAVLQAIGRVVRAPMDPINDCQLPAAPGISCQEGLSRYFFNSEKGVCEEFTYGGCLGNKNNFETLEECNQQCNPNGCPPLCSHEFCTGINTRRSLCTLPTPQGDCDTECRITYCHTCYYADEDRPLPGNCDTCSYYPEVRQTVNRCFKRWAVCTRRAHAINKARGKKERTPERFKCYEHPCL